MAKKKTIYFLGVLVSLLIVIFYGNYWFSKQLQSIQQDKKITKEKVLLPKKKTLKMQGTFVKIDPLSDPLAPMLKKNIEPKTKKKQSVGESKRVYEISEAKEVLIQ